jgi:hypothetical protein
VLHKLNRAIIPPATIIIILLISSITFFIYPTLTKNDTSEPFYVGVTFGGNTSSDAKILIDRVKNCTNLFVLASGTLQRNSTALDEIGDYAAVASGLNFAVYSGVDEAFQTNTWVEWIDSAEQRWGRQFLGIYYNDEPGGKMLDSGTIDLSNKDNTLIKFGRSSVSAFINGTYYSFRADGSVTATTNSNSSNVDSQNGILRINDPNGTLIAEIWNAP